MSGVVGGIPGVTVTGISHSRNRLAVGVATSDVQPLVEEQLARLGIPREAVIIEYHPPVKFLFSLQDMHRPLVGGLQITFFTQGVESGCTLGFTAIREGIPGFVTASHCTADPGGVEGTEFFQHLSPLRVGVETVDPRYLVTHADDSRCPLNPDGTTRNCRYSDSAFARRVIGVDIDQGSVAKTELGSIAWNGVDTFRIVGEAAMIMAGDPVHKVGHLTGRTRGVVTDVCRHVSIVTDLGLDTNVTLICQSQADFTVTKGDSGAPVGNLLVPSDNVRLYGILWGGGGWFSPIANIQRADFELGPLTKCAPGFGC